MKPAVPPEHYAEYRVKGQIVSEEMIEGLTLLVDEFEEQVAMPKEFIIPGGSPASAAINVARTVVRRAERRAVQLKEEGLLPSPSILEYLNRLADLLFILALYEEEPN